MPRCPRSKAASGQPATRSSTNSLINCRCVVFNPVSGSHYSADQSVPEHWAALYFGPRFRICDTIEVGVHSKTSLRTLAAPMTNPCANMGVFLIAIWRDELPKIRSQKPRLRKGVGAWQQMMSTNRSSVIKLFPSRSPNQDSGHDANAASAASCASEANMEAQRRPHPSPHRCSFVSNLELRRSGSRIEDIVFSGGGSCKVRPRIIRRDQVGFKGLAWIIS